MTRKPDLTSDTKRHEPANNGKSAGYDGLKSIPPFATKAHLKALNGVFYSSDTNIDTKNGMGKPIPQEKIQGFTPAKSHIRNSPKGKRYYIDFYAYDEATDKKKRKVIYCPSAIAKNKTSRQNWLIEMKAIINEQLAAGAYFPNKSDELKPSEEFAPIEANEKAISIKDGLYKIVEIKEKTGRDRTGTTYKSAVNLFVDYLRSKGMENQPVDSLKSHEVIGYLDYISVHKKLSNRTRNNHLLYLRALFNHLIERTALTVNPCDSIKYIETESSSHRVFSAEDRGRVEAYLLKNNIRLFYFTRFMYFCFIRRKELHHLQIKHIQLPERKIIIPANVAKTKKQAAVFIPEPMANYIAEMNLTNLPDYYIFSNNFLPGSKPWHVNRSTEAHRKALEELNIYGKGYDLYSWKHTGNVNAYKSGVDIISIQTQNRHTKIETTRVYLKELGLIENAGIQGKEW